MLFTGLALRSVVASTAVHCDAGSRPVAVQHDGKVAPAAASLVRSLQQTFVNLAGEEAKELGTAAQQCANLLRLLPKFLVASKDANHERRGPEPLPSYILLGLLSFG